MCTRYCWSLFLMAGCAALFVMSATVPAGQPAPADGNKPPSAVAPTSGSAPRVGQLPRLFVPPAMAAVRGYVPAHERTRVAPATGAVLRSGTAAAERTQTAPSLKSNGAPELMFSEEENAELLPDEFGDPATCDDCYPVFGGGCASPCTGWWDRLELFGGAHGFTGPVNRGQTGSFGFHEGVNWGAPLSCIGQGMWGMQFGMRATHSNFSGASFTDEERQQIFVTGGVFRRVDWGFQAGVVVDYLHEDWYLEADLVQLRGEASWLYPCHHEIGFWFTANTQKDLVQSRIREDGQVIIREETLQATDLFAFFYRYRANNCGGATGRVFAGFTGAADGLIGADVHVPVNDRWAIQSGFTYLVPDESNSSRGHIEESWNFGLALVWRPGGGLLRPDYYRPLLNVADNGSFMVDGR